MGRPARVAGIRGPLAVLSARSEAIAQRAGEQARRGGGAAPGPGGGAYIPGPSCRKPRRFLGGAGTAAATWGAGSTPGAGGLEPESQPHPALAPAVPSASRAMAHPFFQLTLRNWTAPPRNPRTGVHFPVSAA